MFKLSSDVLTGRTSIWGQAAVAGGRHEENCPAQRRLPTEAGIYRWETWKKSSTARAES